MTSQQHDTHFPDRAVIVLIGTAGLRQVHARLHLAPHPGPVPRPLRREWGEGACWCFL
ncbi:hypothetical protein EES45_35520 [Streptomyces sp. ADI97-07]|nr:hypothetical protein EES45_35520 [Streptomyces sp. ADI97-07]